MFKDLNAVISVLLILLVFSVNQIEAQPTSDGIAVRKARITHPKAGEILPASGSYTIRWDNADPEDTLRLEYSADGGSTWSRITDKASGLAYTWSPVPDLKGTNYTLRIIPPEYPDITGKIQKSLLRLEKPDRINGHPFDLGILSFFRERAIFSPDGKYILSYIGFNGSNGIDYLNERDIALAWTPERSQGLILLWESKTGKILKMFDPIEKRGYNRFAYDRHFNSGLDRIYQWFTATQWWSPDGTKFLAPLSDNSIVVYRSDTFQPLCTLSVPQRGLLTQCDRLLWSPDSKKVLGVVHYLYRSKPKDIQFTPDSLVAERITWSSESGQLIHRRGENYWNCDYGTILNNKRDRLATFCKSPDGIVTLYIRDAHTGHNIITYTLPQGFVPVWPINSWYASGSEERYWSPDDSYFFINISLGYSTTTLGNKGRHEVLLMDIANGTVNHVLPSQSFLYDYNYINWSPDSKRLFFYEFLKTPHQIVVSQQAFTYLIETGKKLVVPGTDIGSMSPVTQSNEPTVFGIWSANGKHIALEYGGPRKGIGIWNTTNVGNNLLYHFRISDAVSTIQWCSDNRRLLAAGGDGKNRYVITLPDPVAGDTIAGWSIANVGQLTTPAQVVFPRLLCKSIDTAVIQLSNTGTQSIAVQSLSLTGANANEYRLLPPIASGHINAGERLQQRVVFVPSSPGLKRSALHIQWNDAQSGEHRDSTLIEALKDSTGFDVSVERVEFYTTLENTAQTQSLSVKNTGTIPLGWAAPREIGLFRVESVTPNPTAAGVTSELRIRFAGALYGTDVRDTLALSDSCGRLQRIALHGVVEPPAPAISTAERVDFGRALCTVENRAVLSVRNTGGKPLVIRALRFEGFAGFSLETPPLLPLEIAGGAEIHIPLRVQCTTTGKYSAMLLITSNASNGAERRVMLQTERQTSSLQWSRDTLDLGVVAENGMAESRVRLNNTGTTAFELPQTLAVGWVSVEIPSNRVIEPGGSVECVVRRSGSGGGSYTERLVLRDSCGVERALFVRVQVISGRWSVTPEQQAIELGAESDVGVFIQNRQGIKPGMEIRAALRIENATVVGCIAPQAIERNYDTVRHIERLTVRDTIRSAAESEAVMRLRFLALQGNDTATTVAVERVWVSGVELSASGNARRARIVVTGINESGGLRRLYPASLRLLSLAPNPAEDDGVTMMLQSNRVQSIRISIIDVMGRVRRVLDIKTSEGIGEYRLSISGFDPGLYAVVLQGQQNREAGVLLVRR